jgi:hypothetical protein
MNLIAEIKSDTGQTIAVITVPPKEFSTGSRGYYGNSRVEIEGKRYTMQIQIVEIGSKKAKEEASS